MSLTTALNIAQNALLTASRRTGVASQNISNADNTDYSRRTAILVSDASGVRVGEIRRATNEALMRQNLSALSAWEGQQKLSGGLDGLALSVNGVDNAASPATALGALQEALHLYSATPSSQTLAESAVDAARQLARSLNEGSAEIQAFRSATDGEIGDAVDDLNRLLAEFGAANKEVTSANASGRDAADALDSRDAILRKIAEYIPVSTFSRTNGDMVVTTSGGVTLFETKPRAVSFEPTRGLAAGSEGNAVTIDGVPVNASGSSGEPLGRLAAMIKLRDEVAVTFQAQLDEIARGAIAAFAETDRSGAGGQPLAGLLTWPGGPSLPSSGGVPTGLAATIAVSSAFDPAAGGNPLLLRDGGANGSAYAANSGNASFADLLIDYGNRLDAGMSFHAEAGIATAASLAEFSSGSIGWIEGLRQRASRGELSSSALMARTAEALSNETGVNLDTEMALLLDLEHAYQASARIIRTVDEMLATLMQATG